LTLLSIIAIFSIDEGREELKKEKEMKNLINIEGYHIYYLKDMIKEFFAIKDEDVAFDKKLQIFKIDDGYMDLQSVEEPRT